MKLDEPKQAAAVKLGGWQDPDPEGSQSAQAVAEASLKLALLCNELLQVWYGYCTYNNCMYGNCRYACSAARMTNAMPLAVCVSQCQFLLGEARRLSV